MNLRVLGGALALTVLVGSGVVAADRTPVQAQTIVAQTQGQSNRNLWYVRRRIEGLIDQLQNDRHDYGGYRVKAIADLQQARNDIVNAIQYQQH